MQTETLKANRNILKVNRNIYKGQLCCATDIVVITIMNLDRTLVT